MVDQQLYKLLKDEFYEGLGRDLTSEEHYLLRWISYKQISQQGITVESDN
ncbi:MULTISPECIES: hypothetical protein [Bacillaceae]|uniref:Uncharacterized protein n=1 Tax=Evansella alkalicola TaxID=745819 RepID=A0ABS6K016_9BACI|nr:MULTISPECIES: hypothetical protein [Bacillaceae]MBU9724196.1 hypothetical protein [Bacillus alkalicola]